MSIVVLSLDTDLSQPRSDARLATPETFPTSSHFARESMQIVEFGPLLAFTACLMNFEKLAHGSPQWTQGAQTHTSPLLVSILPLFGYRPAPAALTETRYNLRRLRSDNLGETHFVTFDDTSSSNLWSFLEVFRTRLTNLLIQFYISLYFAIIIDN